MNTARAIRSAFHSGFWTWPNSTLKLSTSPAQQNFMQLGTFFCSFPTCAPDAASLTGKFTSAHGPQGNGQQSPHWQQPPVAFNAAVPSASLIWKVRSRQAKGSLIVPMTFPDVVSFTVSSGLLKQRQVQVRGRLILNTLCLAPFAVKRTSTSHGAQSGKHFLDCRMQQFVFSTMKKISCPFSALTEYLLAISNSLPNAAEAASIKLIFSWMLTRLVPARVS
mmetsp:Transcript_46342/g.104154  ORF Transcript_46342/g.104154 Transcript_46342/m.104154 type:complete len:221 (+) Transcript_46342:142-804(+)